MRTNAANWLELAHKVWNYRQDVLGTRESEELLGKMGDLRRLVRENADAANLKLGIEALEGVLVRTGGAIYPKTSLVENVEFFLVAAIVILGIRTYFVQPFKIPTNSMWPTYFGMTAENFPPGSPAPNVLDRAFRFAAFGAVGRTMIAPKSGEVSVPLLRLTTGDYEIPFTKKPGRKWFIIPTVVKEYTFMVDGEPATVQLPEDFGDIEFNDLVFNTFYPNKAALDAQVSKMEAAGRVEEVSMQRDQKGGFYMALLVPMGRTVRAGDPILRFDVLAGDQLFVDRISYQFMRPQVGQGFVFRTDHIPEIERQYGDQYFVKRLIGGPGDKVEIRQPMIYRNGAPITGAKAFTLNADKTPPYRGYFNATHDDERYQMLYPGQQITVPDDGYLAMGDNSHDSFDGRYWGFVPKKDVIGRPIFIYFPFTKRWGPAH